MRTKTFFAFVLFFGFFFLPFEVRAVSGEPAALPAYREGEVLVKFRVGSDEDDRAWARGFVGALNVRKIRRLGIEKLSLSPGITALEAVQMLRSDPSVEYAELNWRVRFLDMPRVEPGDPDLSSQWHLDAPPLTGYFLTISRPVLIDRDVDAPEAWAVMQEVFTGPVTGGTIGVLDSGCGEFGYFQPSLGYIPNHEDLPNSSLWVNSVELLEPGDSPSDANSYADDVNGWDFMDDDNTMTDPYNLVEEWLFPHGTFISGIIAAGWDNGRGGVGLGAGKVKVMPLRSLYLDETLLGIDYAIQTTSGAPPVRVLNASWTFEHDIQALREAIEAAGEAGIALVAAASNDGLNNDPGAGAFPAEYTKVPLDNVLAVAASSSTGGLAYFSNYGPESVQVAAPGHGIFSIHWGTDEYETESGTSFAAPIAASALAIIMSVNPGLTPAQAIDRVIDGGDFDARLSGLIRSGKRVNLAGTLAPFAPYSGCAPLDTLRPIASYGDSVSALYGSIVSAVSESPSVAVMVSLPDGSWAVSPVSPGLTTFTLQFDGALAPVTSYETGPWRVTGISPFFAQVEAGQSMTFSSLIPAFTTSWSLTDPAVGSINSSGVFTALAEGTTRIILNVEGQDMDNSGIIVVTSAPPQVEPETGGGGGGGCATTAPPGDEPWTGMAGMAVVLAILFLMRKRAVKTSSELTVQGCK